MNQVEFDRYTSQMSVKEKEDLVMELQGINQAEAGQDSHEDYKHGNSCYDVDSFYMGGFYWMNSIY